MIDDFCGPEGGTEQHLLFLAAGTARDLLELHFAVLTRIRRTDAEDFPVRPVMLVGRRRGLRGSPERLRLLASFIKSAECIDVVHAFSRTSEAFACLAVKWQGRGKVLAIRRNLGYWHTWRSRWTARTVGRFGAEYAANCEAARQAAAKIEWVAPTRIAVIPKSRFDGSVAGRASPAVRSRRIAGIVDGESVVGIVATVRPVKDYATFRHAARLVLDRRPSTRFLAVGVQQFPYAEQMRATCRPLGTRRSVSWLGAIDNPISVMPLFDVAVFEPL